MTNLMLLGIVNQNISLFVSLLFLSLDFCTITHSKKESHTHAKTTAASLGETMQSWVMANCKEFAREKLKCLVKMCIKRPLPATAFCLELLSSPNSSVGELASVQRLRLKQIVGTKVAEIGSFQTSLASLTLNKKLHSYEIIAARLQIH